MSPARLEGVVLADDPQAWAAAGFRVERGRCPVGGVEIELTGRGGPGATFTALRVSGLLEGADLDGLALWPAEHAERRPAAEHPNSVLAIDHVVAFTPDRARTADRLVRAGLSLRRLREEPTAAGGGPQAFFRLGEAILELVEQPELPAPRLWGIAFTVRSLPDARGVLREGLGEARDAVQPARRIASLRRAAGLGIPVALMSAGPPGD